MKGKMWFLIGFFIILVLAMGISCWEYPERKTDAPEPDPKRTFRMEYDYMWGYDVFAQGTQKADSAFSPANTDLVIHFDDIIEPAHVVDWESLGIYLSWYWEITGGPDPRFVYKSYMMAMQDADGKPSEQGEEMLGYTAAGGLEGLAHSVIFVQAIMDNYPGDQNMIDKTPIHEMGHIRGLHDLCDTNGIFNPEHDENDCVMGQGKYPVCTGQDVSINPHFCSACCDRVKQVEW